MGQNKLILTVQLVQPNQHWSHVARGYFEIFGSYFPIYVAVAPTTVSLTGNQQIIANGQNKLTLSCTTDSANPTATVTWWNGASQITTGVSQTSSPGSYGGRNTVGKLEIRPTRDMDGDSISCRTSNSQGPSDPLEDRVALNLTCKCFYCKCKSMKIPFKK